MVTRRVAFQPRSGVAAALRPFNAAEHVLKSISQTRKHLAAREQRSVRPRLDSAVSRACALPLPSSTAQFPAPSGTAVAPPRCIVGLLFGAARAAPASLYRLTAATGAWQCRDGDTYLFQSSVRGRPDLTYKLAQRALERLANGHTPASVKEWLWIEKRRAKTEAKRAEPQRWPATQSAAGYKIIVDGVPETMSSGQIAAWLAATACPKPRDIEASLQLSPLGRGRLCLTFESADQAVCAKVALRGHSLEPSRSRTRTAWWEPAGFSSACPHGALSA